MRQEYAQPSHYGLRGFRFVGGSGGTGNGVAPPALSCTVTLSPIGELSVP
jgi:hypothetical protein